MRLGAKISTAMLLLCTLSLAACGGDPATGGARKAAGKDDPDPAPPSQTVEVMAYVFAPDGAPAPDRTLITCKHTSYGDGVYDAVSSGVFGGQFSCPALPAGPEPLQILQYLPAQGDKPLTAIVITDEMVSWGEPYRLPDIHLTESGPICGNGTCEAELGEACNVCIDDCGWCDGEPPAPQGCDATTCPDGCCDDTGTCQPGTAVTQCGSSGGQCVDCTVMSGTCDAFGASGGSCFAPP